MTDNIVVLRWPQGQTRQRERKKERGNRMQRMKMWKFTEQPEAKWAIRWKVSKDKDKVRKKDRKGKEEYYSERKNSRQWITSKTKNTP